MTAERALDFPEYEFHPVANLFPLMDDEALGNLAKDIEAHGQREPIWIADGKIIDGRNRYLACKKLGRVPAVRQWNFQTGDSIVEFVLSLNLHRRHLTPSQRAAVAAEALPLFEAEAKERQRLSEGRGAKGVAILPHLKNGKARDKAAATAKVSPRYVQDAKKVKETAPELHEKVKSGEISLSTAKRTLEEPEPPQADDDDPPAKASAFIQQKRAKFREFLAITRQIRDAGERLVELISTEQEVAAYITPDLVSSIQSYCPSFHKSMLQAQPHAECPYCHNDKLDRRHCKVCNSRGWVNKIRTLNVPPEYKKDASK